MSQSQVTAHTTEIDITNLPTKSVTFAPNTATVTREIENIQIKVSFPESEHEWIHKLTFS